MKYKVSIEAKTPKLWSVLRISQIHYCLPISATKHEGQNGSTPGSYIGCLGFKPRQAVRPLYMRIIQPLLRSGCLHPRSSNYAETVSLNKRLNAAAATVFWHVTPCTFMGRQVWVSEKYTASFFRVECFLKSWNNFFWHLKGWSELELRVNWQGIVITGVSGRRA